MREGVAARSGLIQKLLQDHVESELQQKGLRPAGDLMPDLLVYTYVRVEAGKPPPHAVAEVVAADLRRSGRFKPLSTDEMLAQPTRGEEVDFRDWRALNVDNLVIGEISPNGPGGYLVKFYLYDVFRGEQLTGYSMPTTARDLRATAHSIADIIYETLTGQPGAFAAAVDVDEASYQHAPWMAAYAAMAALMLVGMLTTLFSPEPEVADPLADDPRLQAGTPLQRLAAWLWDAVVLPAWYRGLQAPSSFDGKIRERVTAEILELAATVDEVARRLAMSERTLHRRLSEKGLSFKALVERTRRDLAESLLRESRYTVSEVAFLTGFSEQSAFNRAFKRWAGQTPTAYRKAGHVS